MIGLGKALYTILSANTAVRNYIGTKIYPLVVPQETLAPYLTYERQANADYSRDLLNGYVNTVSIKVLANNYSDSVSIAEAVNAALSSYKGSVSGINIIDVRLTNVGEDIAEDGFYQTLTYTIRAN